jgi:hypothetical protein
MTYGRRYLAHSMLFVNNLEFNGNEAQRAKFLPDACTGAPLRYRAAVGCSSTPPMDAIGLSSARDRPFLSFSFFHLGSCPCRPRQLGVRHDSA